MKNIIFILLSLPFNLIAQTVDYSPLKKHLSPFSSIEADAFYFLDDKLDNVRLVGYGEDTHGTAEFTIITKELFKYLVKNQKFRILIIEDAFGMVRTLNEYIQTGEGTLMDILSPSNWRYYTEEFYQLVEWLRLHNQQFPNDRVKLYGAEMQYIHKDAHFLEQYLLTLGVKKDFSKLKTFRTIWDNTAPSDVMDFIIFHYQLKQLFLDNKEEWIAKTSQKAYDLAYQHLDLIHQFLSTVMQSNSARFHDFRELYMTQNIEWILQHEGKNSKAMFWAHNNHIGSASHNGLAVAVGHHLKMRYEDTYFNIYSDFGKGSFWAYPHDAGLNGKKWLHQVYTFDSIAPQTFTHFMDEQGRPNAFIDLRQARQDKDAKCILAHPFLVMSGAGAQYHNTRTMYEPIGNSFDAIFYIAQTSKLQFLGEL